MRKKQLVEDLNKFKKVNTVYILKCSDNTLYTGSTTDLTRRFRAHNEQKGGAKYTRARRPVIVVFKEECTTLTDARKREAEIKRMTRKEKLLLIETYEEE